MPLPKTNTPFYPLVIKLIFIAYSFVFSSLAAAESVLQVLPTRVVLEKEKRATTVTLINRGDEDGSYRMFFRNIRANDKGEFSEIVEPRADELFADQMVRFSPRRITVPARSKQSIRVVVRKPKNLESAEYRSHLVFRKLPKQESVLTDEKQESALGFSLRPIVEVTIPVIVRHGEVDAKVNLSDATLAQNNGAPEVNFIIHREGNRSLYGDVNIWWLNNDGAKKNVGMARGIAVYSPNSLRNFNMPLDADSGALNNGKLLIEFNEDPAYGGNRSATIETAL